jgi:acyl-CoA hydrolase/RimJ/RimL family protein N-acetyltransferase
MSWQQNVVTPGDVLERLEPGMRIFLSTAAAEPRTLIKHLMESSAPNLDDLELIQLVSFGEAISLEDLDSKKFRLKTFYSGGVASDAITAGRVDLIPSRFSLIPELIERQLIPIDVAFLRVTPPDPGGYCSLGVSVDVAHLAMEQAKLVVGEISPEMPKTYGDTFVNAADFDLLVEGTEPLLEVPRMPVSEVLDRVAANVASVVENGDCLAFTIGPLYEAFGAHLANKRNLGVHTPFFTDAVMDLVKSGAVSNRRKALFRGKSLTSYALGTRELMRWLDRNPLVEFQGIDKVFSPLQLGKNPNLFVMVPTRKVDLSGRVALPVGRGNIAATTAEAVDFVNGAELSEGGRTAFALPSRNKRGESNVRISVEEFPNQFTLREAVDMVVTEYGVAWLRGRTVRERAQAIIEVAHPDDRPLLVQQAKEARILYQDQIFLQDSAHLYPSDIVAKESFKNGVEVRFRALRPSDEEEMRRLFYRFSDESVYYRYFSRIKSMPHAKMQQYVNVDYRRTLSIVGLSGEPGAERIIAEGRFVKHNDRPLADVAFVVDEQFQDLGIATYLFTMLMRLAAKRGIQGFTADVLASNKRMIKVFEKVGKPVRACLQEGAYELTMRFDQPTSSRANATDTGSRR